MSTQTIATPQITRPNATIDPPRWLLIAIGAACGIAVLGLAFWPGATMVDRLRALTSGICAQIPTHILRPGGVPLPLCSRNTGIYLGLMTGVGALIARGRWRSATLPTGWVALVLLGFVGLMGIDGFNSLFVDVGLPHLYQPNNLLRLTTGLLCGTAMAAFLAPTANSMLWRRPDPQPAYDSLRFLLPLAPVLLLDFGLAAWQAGWLLYPIALVSVTGVVLAWTLINLTFITVFTGRTGRYQRLVQIVPIVAIALVLAVAELLALAVMKHSLLGTA
jgi:uncharacterized membrane protein